MFTKLEKITEMPKPSAASIAAAEATGATIVPYSPARLRAFLAGRITLGDLEGIDKAAQYQLAEMGYQFINEGRFDKAKTVFEGLLTLDPFDAYFHLVMGTVFHRDNDLDAAISHYSRSLEINPYSVHALANRGEARMAAGDAANGLEDLFKSIDLDPEGKDAASQRARVLLDSVMKQAAPAGAAKEAPRKGTPSRGKAPMRAKGSASKGAPKRANGKERPEGSSSRAARPNGAKRPASAPKSSVARANGKVATRTAGSAPKSAPARASGSASNAPARASASASKNAPKRASGSASRDARARPTGNPSKRRPASAPKRS